MTSSTARSAIITGRGVVSCFGPSVETFVDAILAGEDGIRDIRDRLTSQRFTRGAPVVDFVPTEHFTEKALSGLDRFTQFAAVAARSAVAESAGALEGVPPERIAVVIGTASGGIDVLDAGFRRLYSEGLRPLPFTIPMTMGNSAASRIAHEIGARGPVVGVTSACASASQAIHLGHLLMRSGVADVAVVGGADAIFNDSYLKAWDVLPVVSPDLCRPFSRDRQGLVLGEGAGILVLETIERAEHRAARGLGRLLGGALTCDAGALLAANPIGMTAAMKLALTDAGLSPEDVDYVNAHGTGTRSNDSSEAQALRTVFGDRVDRDLAVSSTKSQIGHAIGASGGLEAIVTLAALTRGIVPPTLNFTAPDPDGGIMPVPNHPMKRGLRYAISNSFGFGGLNSTLVLAAT